MGENGRHLKIGWTFMIVCIVPLLISSVKKIDSAAIAVELRGFNLRTRESAYKKIQFAPADILVLLFGAALIAAGILL